MLHFIRAPRFKFRAPLDILESSNTIRVWVRELAFNGMFIETDTALLMGATFMANLLVDSPVQMYCCVCRIDPGRGVAVRIAFGRKDHETLYGELVETLRKLPLPSSEDRQ